MEKENLSITKDYAKDRFVYRLHLPEKIEFRLTDDGMKEIYTPNHLLGIEMKIPKKKIIYGEDGTVFDFDDYVIHKMYTKKYIDSHTNIIEDESKFEETHNKAYELLISKLN